MIDKDQMLTIANIIDDTCREAMNGKGIDQADLEIIQKYIDSGAIQFKKPPRGWLQNEIYFPTLNNPEMEGLVGEVWLKLLQRSIRRWGVPSKIGPNSVSEYINKYYEYGMDDYTKVITNNYAGRAESTRQLNLMKEVLKDLDGEDE
jgi:hypothetical protein